MTYAVTEANEALAIVKHNKIALSFLWIFSIAWTAISIFGILIPVLLKGYLNTAWIVHYELNKNFDLFFLALIWVSLAPIQFCWLKNTGTIFIYCDRVEVTPYIGWKKRVFPYEGIQITVKNSRSVLITRKDLPSWSHPWERYKAEFLRGEVTGFNLRNIGDDHYTISAQKALEILRVKAGKL